MNREIKFRAWDGKTMFIPSQITFTDACWTVSNGRGVSIPFQPHIKLMQFTGVTDKNGKEIYEGDKVKRGDTVRIIEFDNGGFFARLDKGFSGETSVPLFLWTNNSEIIGNVYETPELLK